MDVICAAHIEKRFGTRRGVEGVTLSVGQGQCIGILGANGSGKTTLTRLIAGLDRLDGGSLRVLGHPACPRPLHVRRRCGIALDTPAHWETLSGRQNLSFFGRQYGLAGAALKARVDALLSEADLTAQADEPVAAYSFGMRRKLAILQAMAHEPELLILDEPSAGVDTAFLDRLSQAIRRRCQDGHTTWIADNDADWLARTATDAILLRNGRLCAVGRVAELVAAAAARHRIDILLEASGFDAVPTIKGVYAFACEGKQITAHVDGDPALPAELAAWVVSCGGRIRTMDVRAITLSDALNQRAEAAL